MNKKTKPPPDMTPLLLNLIIGSDSGDNQTNEQFEDDCRKAIEMIESNTIRSIERMGSDLDSEQSSSAGKSYASLREDSERMKEPFIKALNGETPRKGLRVYLPGRS